MTPLAGRAVIHQDGAELARAAAEDFIALAADAISQRGRFTAALTGGGSPVELYGLLADERFASRIDWGAVHLFWGDDRVVPPAHPRSNFGLAQRLFLRAVPIPRENLHRIRGELGVARASREYAAEVGSFFAGPPRFDLVYLGLGDDGHVASLFPFDLPRLLERSEPAVASLYRELAEWRVTLTYPVLNAAGRVEFLLPSAEKARIARTAMRGPIDPLRIPAQGIVPVAGQLLWRLTRALERATLDTTAA